jgi:hypothetical protein
VLQKLLAANDVKMALDLRVFLGESIDFFLTEATA